MKELEYPFDAEYILKKKKSIKKALLAENASMNGGTNRFLPKKIAILGGSTTNDIKLILELFLLNYGIEPSFYESEYNQYYQDACFPNPELEAFAPDLIYIHTTFRNLTMLPCVGDSSEIIEEKLEAEYRRFEHMWEQISQRYHCSVIQNNVEFPAYRLLGNMDSWDEHGATNFVMRLNQKMNDYARSHEGFYLQDYMYVASCYGMDAWQDDFYWHMYKYAMAVPAIPYLAFNLAKIIKSIYGKNKKALVLDLDNTLWGGVVGDDGVDNLALGMEVPSGQVYTEFQSYLKAHKDLGILLNVNSKNDYENAIAGLNHPDGVLKPEDFVSIKANWENKDQNILHMAEELSLGADSFVFVDDNPAERAIVSGNVPGIAVPDMDAPEHYVRILDRNGYFEPTSLSADDAKRVQMYQENAKRASLQASFADYGEYLKSLEMVGTIRGFEPLYMARIAQLTNKSNQFNLTTKRISQADIEAIAENPGYLTQYGKLEDKFGDNGVVSVVIGRIRPGRMSAQEAYHNGSHLDELMAVEPAYESDDALVLDVNLWLMSCRVLKRNMEGAMLDTLVHRALAQGVSRINGYYYPTAKNRMVEKFYETMGFTKISVDEAGNSVWTLEVSSDYNNSNVAIEIRTKDAE